MLNHGQVVRLIFGLKLRELRQERGLSPAELARACDVSVSYLNEIEKGKKYPKADKILSLSKALEVLGHDIFAQIPNEYSTMVEARNNGVPLITQAPKAKLTKSIIQLAQNLDQPAESDEVVEERKPVRKSLFSFLGSGSK